MQAAIWIKLYAQYVCHILTLGFYVSRPADANPVRSKCQEWNGAMANGRQDMYTARAL